MTAYDDCNRERINLLTSRLRAKQPFVFIIVCASPVPYWPVRYRLVLRFCRRQMHAGIPSPAWDWNRPRGIGRYLLSVDTCARPCQILSNLSRLATPEGRRSRTYDADLVSRTDAAGCRLVNDLCSDSARKTNCDRKSNDDPRLYLADWKCTEIKCMY